jgi:hypothetical protein
MKLIYWKPTARFEQGLKAPVKAPAWFLFRPRSHSIAVYGFDILCGLHPRISLLESSGHGLEQTAIWLIQRPVCLVYLYRKTDLATFIRF